MCLCSESRWWVRFAPVRLSPRAAYISCPLGRLTHGAGPTSHTGDSHVQPRGAQRRRGANRHRLTQAQRGVKHRRSDADRSDAYGTFQEGGSVTPNAQVGSCKERMQPHRDYDNTQQDRLMAWPLQDIRSLESVVLAVAHHPFIAPSICIAHTIAMLLLHD